ncbi:hypothetical protein LAZ67_8002178 [Cordylochernes scorpioides]|uniref:Uncharacterized protein n=1 Tax=Cordylochernes scorpioides TaxID=51811 RepID=A0ABY6KSP6_9ARAC|nr:hypothetical protein LAZ67_8002178 [Cordylochernes scorpioides]
MNESTGILYLLPPQISEKKHQRKRANNVNRKERWGTIAPLVSHIPEFPVHGYRSGSGLTTPYFALQGSPLLVLLLPPATQRRGWTSGQEHHSLHDGANAEISRRLSPARHRQKLEKEAASARVRCASGGSGRSYKVFNGNRPIVKEPERLVDIGDSSPRCCDGSGTGVESAQGDLAQGSR